MSGAFFVVRLSTLSSDGQGAVKVLPVRPAQDVIISSVCYRFVVDSSIPTASVIVALENDVPPAIVNLQARIGETFDAGNAEKIVPRIPVWRENIGDFGVTSDDGYVEVGLSAAQVDDINLHVSLGQAGLKIPGGSDENSQ